MVNKLPIKKQYNSYNSLHLFCKPFLKGALLLFFILCLSNDAYAQMNLVPNSSFEQYTNCPNRNLYLGTGNPKNKHLISPDIWYKPDRGGGGTLMLVQIVLILRSVFLIIMDYIMGINMLDQAMHILVCFIGIIQHITIFKLNYWIV
jgi:hypothetical protein